MMAGKQNEANRILKKYPDHLPVICVNEDESDKRKLLVPAKMKGSEIVATARSRCPWASEEARLFVDGKLLDSAQSAAELYAVNKAQDGFLYILVTEKAVSQLEEKSKQEEPRVACAQPPVSSGGSSPPVFHMPDNDDHKLSADAKKARKVLKKYPDRVPVLVKQAATAGLPAIDKKLLVPRPMTCAGLQAILPKHLGIPEEANVAWDKLRISMGEDPLEASAVMSEVYCQYVDDHDGILHVSLWIDMPSLPVEAPVDEQHQQETWKAPSLEEAKEAQKFLEEAKQELEKVAKEAAAAKAKTEAAESSAMAEANRAADAEARALAAEEKAAHMGQAFLAESEKVAQLKATLLEAEEKIKALEAAQTLAGSELLAVREQLAQSKETSQEADALQQQLELARTQAEEKLALEAERAKAAEAALEEKVKQQTERAELAEKAKEAALLVASAEAARANSSEQNQEEEGKKLRAELRLLKDRLTEELAEKAAAQEKAKSFEERLAAIQAEAEKAEEAKKKKEAERVAEYKRKKEQQEQEGFVHLGWDHDGFAAEVEVDDNEFELLVADEA